MASPTRVNSNTLCNEGIKLFCSFSNFNNINKAGWARDVVRLRTGETTTELALQYVTAQSNRPILKILVIYCFSRPACEIRQFCSLLPKLIPVDGKWDNCNFKVSPSSRHPQPPSDTRAELFRDLLLDENIMPVISTPWSAINVLLKLRGRG